MPNDKKSFLIYRDAYMHVLALSPEQRGELFSSLFWYAERLSQQEYVDVTIAAAQCTTLNADAKMAFRFMADAIQRDPLQWREKQANYLAAAQRRKAEKQKTMAPMPFKGRGVDVYPTAEEYRALQED